MDNFFIDNSFWCLKRSNLDANGHKSQPAEHFPSTQLVEINSGNELSRLFQENSTSFRTYQTFLNDSYFVSFTAI